MMLLAQILFIIFVVAASGASLLRLVDIAADREDREKFKARIEAFWMETSGIVFGARLRRALRSRYGRTRALRFTFLKTFWLICFAFAVSFSLISIFSKEDAAGLVKLIETNFDQRFRIHCTVLLSPSQNADEKKDFAALCNPADSQVQFEQLKAYRQQLTSYKVLIERLETSSPFFLKASNAASTFIQITIIAVPLSLALWVSLNLTLKLLSGITASRLRFALVVVFDVLIALLMPPLITSLMTSILIAGLVFGFGQFPDFFVFQSANWLSLTVGKVFFVTSINFIFPALIGLFALLLPANWGIYFLLGMLIFAPVGIAYYRALEFFSDVKRVLLLDTAIDVITSLINWAIFLDLAFSIIFLVPCLALVLANRNATTRKIFLNFAMWIHDHQKGPFVAISEILSSFPKVSGKS
jgi:hypothetical protein